MKTKLLTPDYSKKRFTITIEVFKNGNLFSTVPEKNYKPAYQEIVGAIEITKYSLLSQQSGNNQKEYSKIKKKENLW